MDEGFHLLYVLRNHYTFTRAPWSTDTTYLPLPQVAMQWWPWAGQGSTMSQGGTEYVTRGVEMWESARWYEDPTTARKKNYITNRHFYSAPTKIRVLHKSWHINKRFKQAMHWYRRYNNYTSKIIYGMITHTNRFWVNPGEELRMDMYLGSWNNE